MATSTPLRGFIDRLKILTSIDMHEMVEAGVIKRGDAHEWRHFLRDPYRWLLRADDDTAERLWSVIERRAAGSNAGCVRATLIAEVARGCIDFVSAGPLPESYPHESDDWRRGFLSGRRGARYSAEAWRDRSIAEIEQQAAQPTPEGAA